jgi:transcriptional regulator with XRE-family HTH domain
VSTYELIFQTEPLTETVMDAIEAEFDALISGHGTSYMVTVSAEGRDAVTAADSALLHLRNLGAHPYRLVEDLVSRSEIARRVGVAPQAVGQWIRGERRAEQPFPEVFNAVAGGVWLWADVVDWLEHVNVPGVDLDEAVAHPHREDYWAVNHRLVAEHSDVERARTIGGLVAAVSSSSPVHAIVTIKETTSRGGTQARSGRRMGSWSDYGLAS